MCVQGELTTGGLLPAGIPLASPNSVINYSNYSGWLAPFCFTIPFKLFE
jgi:hypothetical protein